MANRLLPIAAAGGLLGALLGQQPGPAPAWRIPAGGALAYERSGAGAASAPQPKARAAAAAPTEARLPPRFVPRLTPAAVLCDGELDAARAAVAGPVRDVRDLRRSLAFDLGSRGRVRVAFPQVVPFGAVTVEGTWSPSATTGEQVLDATWMARAAEAGPGEDRAALALLRAVCLGDSDGRVKLHRTVDATNGRVAAWESTVDLVIAEAEGQFRRLLLTERWRFTRELDGQDADFRLRVADGIRRGTAWVREAVADGRSYLSAKQTDERHFGGGRLALALLTMVHGHVPPDDPVLVAGFAELQRLQLRDSYSLAAALMAVAARYAPPNEIELLRTGQLGAAGPRRLPDADRTAVAGWLAALLANVDPRAPRDVLRFNYEAGPRYDTSLQQYALLGIWSALLCGVPPPRGTFAACARHLLAVQQRETGRFALELRTYAQQRALELGDPVRTAAPRRVPVRGFAYQEATEAAFGSMTSAGISGLLLARAGMQATGDVDRSLLAPIDASLEAGFAWLAANFSVRCNPGFGERADNHWYYWLYGLERSCELAGIARLQGRDWYYEGALQLLAQQQPNGSFRSESPATMTLDATCFAVLFLAKATAPAAITGK
jgi:hypothetical protein